VIPTDSRSLMRQDNRRCALRLSPVRSIPAIGCAAVSSFFLSLVHQLISRAVFRLAQFHLRARLSKLSSNSRVSIDINEVRN
jgi:hypothetical protein